MTDMASTPALHLEKVKFSWPRSPIILDVNELTIPAGESVFLRGPSGSGKSTLLSLVAGIMSPQKGQIQVLGQEVSKLSAPKRDAFRADHMGIIFQLFNLLPYLSLVDNVLLPTRFSAARAKRAADQSGSAKKAAHDLLGRLGLAELVKKDRPVSTLSVGQQQRVAAARALIGQPPILIADEPTSALDADNRDAFIETLITETKANGATLLFVSHDTSLASHFTQEISLLDLNKAAKTEALV